MQQHAWPHVKHCPGLVIWPFWCPSGICDIPPAHRAQYVEKQLPAMSQQVPLCILTLCILGPITRSPACFGLHGDQRSYSDIKDTNNTVST